MVETLSLQQLLKQRVLVIDGAMGTALQEKNLSPADFGGEAYDGCNEHLVLTKPEAIYDVHCAYLEAGADIIETNTFGGTPLVLQEYDLQDQCVAINTEAVRLAKDACKRYATPERPRFVAGSMGPTTKALSVTGGISFDDLAQEFYYQAKPLIEAGVDYLLFETALDTLNLKASYIGTLRAFEELGITIPIALSGTIETMGTMLAGQTSEAFYTSIEHMTPLYVGFNCATGPAFMKDHIRTLSQLSQFPVAVVPNAGIPDAEGQYPESPIDMAQILGSFINEGWLNLIGGCCGTTPAHIKALSNIAQHATPRQPVKEKGTARISGIDPYAINEDNRPAIVGERSNVIGSRAFKRLITENKWDEASEIARKQVKSGAHIIDICLSNPDRDEVQDTIAFYDKVSKMVKVPIMVDSQVPEVVETAFKRCQGKCILNSINLEEGEKYFKELLPLVKRYGAAVVVGCIEGEMAVSAADKLKVAQHSHQLLTQKYGLQDEDIWFDPLVFPCGTGDKNYFGSGHNTIEGVRLIKQTLPRCKTVLGISNVSFGLPNSGREVLNSVFLHHCIDAGLDAAIVNSEKLVRFSIITDEEKKLCDDLLWYRTDNNNDPIANFVAYFRQHTSRQPIESPENLPLDKRLEINIVEGTKENLVPNLDEALQTLKPLEVINGPLMAAMDIVGRLFNNNELIVAEVLQSAEVMKAAVSHLEQFMEKTDIQTKGTLVIATVKGDVHDIGKNLVSIILSNNGFKVIDLGIKCPPQVIIDALKQEGPDVILGLSGLLVKSAQQMIITAGDLKSAGLSVPILVGGAALSEQFTYQKIAPLYDGPVIYCKDAMTGLDVCNKLTHDTKRSVFLETLRTRQQDVLNKHATATAPKERAIAKPLVFSFDAITTKAPYFEPKCITKDLNDIWPYINPQMLYGHHMGLKGNVTNLLASGDKKATKLDTLMMSLKKKVIEDSLLSGKGIYQFFKVRRDGDQLIILDSKTETPIKTFVFPRQLSGQKLCLTDFINPNQIDTVCFFVVTAGDGIATTAKKMADDGLYFESHALQSIALEAAEGLAELLHQEIRSEWGIPDPNTITTDDLFKLNYTGVRVSFGYPACPRLEDQALLWELLHPDTPIGVSLSEDFMMAPEASVSALVFHHPQARYFRIHDDELAYFEKTLRTIS